jgi:N-acetylglucosaminyldiphosphoundecaprenol N-acetyl-beta-D-mannosaminyltransferase
MTSSIIGVKIHPTQYEAAVDLIRDWAFALESRYVIAANVHVIMESFDSQEFQNIINQADLVTPDGMPLVWMLRLKGHPRQQRVYGPTLMLHLLEAAAQEGIPVGFYGGTPEALERLAQNMQRGYPALKIAYANSPPFRALTAEEDRTTVQQMRDSGVRILFVGLGCPKQERWMAAHRGQIPAVMVGVGAAFDFHAGIKRQAPPWMQHTGLEWFFRLTQEPARLWRRYLRHNARFLALALVDLIRYRLTKK